MLQGHLKSQLHLDSRMPGPFWESNREAAGHKQAPSPGELLARPTLVKRTDWWSLALRLGAQKLSLLSLPFSSLPLLLSSTPPSRSILPLVCTGAPAWPTPQGHMGCGIPYTQLSLGEMNKSQCPGLAPGPICTWMLEQPPIPTQEHRCGSSTLVHTLHLTSHGSCILRWWWGGRQDGQTGHGDRWDNSLQPETSYTFFGKCIHTPFQILRGRLRDTPPVLPSKWHM